MEAANQSDGLKMDDSPGWKLWKRRRYVVAGMAFLGFFNVYALRTNLSIAIVAMTENKTIVDKNGTTAFVKEFDWDSKEQGYVLSSFFYGYITTQLLGGWLAMRIGGKNLFGLGIGATAFMTIITPFVARTSVYLLIALRILEGIFEGVTYPCMLAIWSKWAPPLERSRLATFTYNGAYVGTVFAMPACACLAEWFGWPSIFYVFGAVGLVWFACWLFLITDDPMEDPHISDAELKYISTSIGTVQEKRIKHPWGSILTSIPVWATIISHFCENWGFYTFLTQLPKYMNDILNFQLAKTGFMAALPYLVMSITLPVSGQLADWLLVKGILNTGQVRKLFNCGAFLSQTIFLIAATYARSIPLILLCLVLAEGLGSFSLAGFSVNYLDLAPRHASVLMGIGNTVGSIPGIVSPILSGYIVTTPTKGEWQIVFFITAGIYLFGCIIFGCFSTGEQQPWATETEVLKPKPTSAGKENKSFEKD